MNDRVTYKVNGKTGQGFLAVPDNPKKAGIIVVQEWWGLNENIKDIAKLFAELGYVALAPDLYDGKVTSEPDEAQKLRMELKLPEAVKNIESAARYLKETHNVEKVGCVGFCMGGTLAILSATTGVIDTVIPFYGRITDDIKNNIEKIKVPVLGIYGTKDHGIPVASVEEFKAALDKQRTINQFHFYDAGHAFFNDTRPEAYNPQASQDAWEKVKAWFEKYLA